MGFTRIRWGFTAAGVLLLLALLAACNIPGAPPATPFPATVILSTPSPEAPGCDIASLIAPLLPALDDFILDSLRPELRWVYEGACAPDAFQVEVAPEGDFASPETLAATTDGPTTSWVPAIDLQRATRYEWRVAARLGDLLGPVSIAQTFFTGPTCSGADLQAPSLVSPEQEAIVADASTALEWASAITSCLQETYNFEVATEPAFSAPVLSGSVGPWPSFDTEVVYLEDCTAYFWRVRSAYGMDMSSPYSTVGIFYTDFLGTCPTHGALPRVSGVVWDDQCESAGVIPGQAPAPPGCVYREGAYGAEGVRQAGEPGVAGVVVRYSAGGCPASGAGEAVWEPTGADGGYLQVLTPGDYCLWLDSGGDGNDEVLGDGLATFPPGGYDAPSNYEITLDWGDVMDGLDFGWDSR